MITTLRRSVKDSCPEDGKNATIKARVLHDACVKLGGEGKLADFLEVPLSVVDSWLKGRSAPPDDIFLKCLDLMERE